MVAKPAGDGLNDTLPESASGQLRLGAYVMIGDPAFLEESLRSYYDIVERIVVAYDESGLSWTGLPLPIDHCLSVVAALDTDHKVEHYTGNFHEPGPTPLETETMERNAALRAVGTDLDWVLQLDTDEVLGNPESFCRSIEHADAAGRAALDYPARWIYGLVKQRTYLERCRRYWGISAGFPGPVAVKPGTQLRIARQCDASTWRVDFRRRNTDPAHSRDAHVDETVRGDDGIWHFSWVRSEEEMRKKATTSGHTGEFHWNGAIDDWLERRQHPWRTTLLTPLRERPGTLGGPTWLRLTNVPESVLRRSG